MAKKTKTPRKAPAAKVNIRKDGEIDLRTLPVEKRPKPSSGQSRKEFSLPLEELSANEAKVLKALNGKGKGLRETLPISGIAKGTRLTPLQVRNSIRRLVPSTWVEGVDEVLDDETGEPREVRGHYRVTERGRKRLTS